VTNRRIRTIDLENPFPETLDGMCELLLVRHGEQQFRSNIPLGEALDAPLSALGEKQAEAVGKHLSQMDVDAVYCSPLIRAHRTGIQIALHQGIEPIIDAGLTEIDIWRNAPQDKGLLDIYTNTELGEIYRGVTRAKKNSAYPHVEDPDAFHTRVVSTIDRIASENVGSRVAIACHGGVINSYLSHCFGSRYDHVVPVHHTSISVVRAADTRRAVMSTNDYAHVRAFQTTRGDLNA
jgi:broad specificity phosphatase PhoE